MTIRVGTVRGREIRENRNGGADVLLLQVEVSDADDIQTVELMTQAGDESSPPDGAHVILVQLGPAWVVAVAADDLIPPGIAEGERRVYSQDGGTRKASIYWRASGQLEINGTGDFAVRFTALETAFNELQTQFNTLQAAYAAHIGHFPGGSVPPVPGTPSVADISLAKVNTVELPS